MWFFEFLGILFTNIEADRKSLASACARDAYDKALKPHHPWLLAKAAGVAMKAVNYREVCIKNICDEQTQILGEEYSEEQCYQDFKTLGGQFNEVAKVLRAYVEENGFDKLP